NILFKRNMTESRRRSKVPRRSTDRRSFQTSIPGHKFCFPFSHSIDCMLFNITRELRVTLAILLKCKYQIIPGS
ncbi:hypothetical protein VIGAN_09048100, partial [Vigna angularis var. angularis]